MRNLFTLLTAALFMLQVSCKQTTTCIDENKIINLDEKSAEIVKGDNAFGLEMFKQVRATSTDENLMVSPLSVSLALAMTYNGADGDTKSEMEKTLNLYGLTPEEINESYKTLIKALQSVDEDVVFEIANAIYYADIFTVKSDFLTINKNYYSAAAESLDFSNPASVTKINGWVAEKTHNKILKIIDSLSDDARMVLLNAIYFYGTWSHAFDKYGTKMQMFYKNDGTKHEVATMSKENKLEYTKNELFSAVKFPYGTGQYNMVVLLPEPGKRSGDIISAMSADKWSNWMNDFKPEEHVVVKMPRFKFSFNIELKNILKSMGMEKAFLPGQADFSNISDDDDLYISKVIHKTYIDVNETGTEAAAVTAVVMSAASAGPGSEVKKIYFTVNKPFVFAITEKDTGAILFIGEVQNPEYED